MELINKLLVIDAAFAWVPVLSGIAICAVSAKPMAGTR